jgi:PAS domain S-box-containing protein
MTPPTHPTSARPAPSGADSLAGRLSAMTHDLLGAASTGDHRLVWTNPAWYPLLGWTEDELHAGSYHRFVHPDDLPRLKRAETALLEGRAGERPETELRVRGRDGAYRWLAFSASHSPADELVFVCGKDVTARKQGEKQLRAAEERYRAVTDSTRDGIVSADSNGRIIFWNAGAEAIFGRSADEALGRQLTELMPERYHDAHRAGVARFLATGEGRLMGSTVEVEGLHADGSEFPLELTLGSWSQSGQRCFTGVLRDVSERVRARHALREAEQRFAGAFEGAAVGLVLAAPDGTLLRANRALRELSGRTEEELAGRHASELLHPDDREDVRPAVQAMLAGETERLAGDQRLLLAGGEVRVVRINLSLVRAATGEPLHFVGQVEDATERHEAERSVEERARELERSNAELEQFAYVASHDLSEPLRMVSSYLQLLRRRYHGRLDGDADDFIDFAVDGAARMRDLIDDLLTYSRAGRGDHPFEPVDTRAVAERAAEAARIQAEGREVGIAIGTLPTVPGDPQGLGQLFQNLVGNAVKFVADGRVAEVEIGAERDGADWRFTVSDNGIGLDPGHADRIFRMFQRLHTRDEYQGTGIGLAIAKKVVERHGGRIWAEPRPEGGSRFSFTLPAQEER